MAKIINNPNGRRSIRLSADDVISIVREYQNITSNQSGIEEIRNMIEKYNFYLPEEI